MELVAVFLADSAGMNDRGALRLDGGYLGWLPLCTESDDSYEKASYLIVVLGRGTPSQKVQLVFELTSEDRPVQFELDVDLPAEPTWWCTLAAPARGLAGTMGSHRLEVNLKLPRGGVFSTAWCEYDVRRDRSLAAG